MSKRDENLEFLNNQIDKEAIYAPETLGEAQMLSKLINTDEDKILKLDESNSKKKRGIAIGVAVAAAFAVIVSSAVAFPYLSQKAPAPIDEIGEVEDEEIGLAHFKSEREINALVDRMLDQNKKSRFGLFKSTEEFAADGEGGEGGMGGGGGSEDFGTTYKQVSEVDEPDVIKTDGTYIYHINNSAIQVYAANGGDPYWVCAIESPAFGTDASDEEYYSYDEDNYYYNYSFINDFYLKDGKLIAVCQESQYDEEGSSETALIQVYDIADVKNPALIDEYRQSGYYTSSRMIGNTVYIISDHYVYDGNYIPYCGVGEGQNNLAPECIYKTDCPTDACFFVIGAVNIESGVENTDTKAIFGASSTVYCNENNMYITNIEGMYTDYKGYNDDYEGKIQIIKAELSDGDIEFTATGFVEGNVNDQFSMDEKDGCLRIATTITDWSGFDEDGNFSQTNNLYVLDENLEIIGSVTGFANDESIRAVRFVGDMAYVITYEYVDPLFIIDLSDKENPQIKGSVEIDGFSSLLAPVDENRLLGIGYSTYEGEYGMMTDGLKVVLFDVSNPENPVVLDSASFYDTSSEAQYNHKALIHNASKSCFAMPINVTTTSETEDGYYEYYDYGSGVLTVKINGNELDFTDDFMVDDSNNEYGNSPRCTYVGNYIYLIDRNGTIHAFEY